MKLIVISSPLSVPNEHEIINSLFEEGLGMFQIHKPSFSKEETENFIQQIPSKYNNRIALHTDFPKFHSLRELSSTLTFPLKKGTCFFLSPIFDSISKIGYKSKIDLQEVKSFLQKQNFRSEEGGWGEALALGGIDEDKIEICRQLGFSGIAVLGAIWQSKNPLEKFLKLKSICSSELSKEYTDASLRSA